MRVLQYFSFLVFLLVIGIPAPIKNTELSLPPYLKDPESLIESQYKDIILEASETYKVCPILIDTIIKYESRNKAKARSRKGARGLMQLMTKTGKAMGVKDFNDPYQNIMGGAKYISRQLKRFKGNIYLALAAYNAGPTVVSKYGGIPPFRETQEYVDNITNDLSSKLGDLRYYNPMLG